MQGDRVRWELGGLVDARGGLGRGMPAGWLAQPVYADVVGDVLMWHGTGPSVAPDRHMLEAFVDLGDAPAARILEYAERWGPLFTRMCQCDWEEAAVGYEMPHHHMRIHYHDPDSEHACRWQLFEMGIDGGSEPLSTWRRYARQARGLLRIAAAMSSGSGTGERNDWEDVYAPSDPFDGGYDLTDPVDAQDMLGQRIDWWLYIAGCRPTVGLGSQRPLRLAGDGLFATIGLQLAMVATVSRGLAICAGCGTVFTPRRLQAGRAAYCRRCGVKAARRDAARRYRERQRSGQADARGSID